VGEQDLERGARAPKKALWPSSQRKTGYKASAYRLIEAEKRTTHSFPVLCRLLGASRGVYQLGGTDRRPREPAWTQYSRIRSRRPTATATPPPALPGCTPSSGSSASVAAESGSPDSCVAQGHAGLRGSGIKTTHRFHPPAGRSGLKGRANKERVGTKLAASHSIIWAGTAAPKTRPQCRPSPIGASS
jgi:hypothetical protein